MWVDLRDERVLYHTQHHDETQREQNWHLRHPRQRWLSHLSPVQSWAMLLASFGLYWKGPNFIHRSNV